MLSSIIRHFTSHSRLKTSSLTSQETQLGSLPTSSAPPSSQAQKKPSLTGLNDYRLVAQMPVVMFFRDTGAEPQDNTGPTVVCLKWGWRYSQCGVALYPTAPGPYGELCCLPFVLGCWNSASEVSTGTPLHPSGSDFLLGKSEDPHNPELIQQWLSPVWTVQRLLWYSIY